MTDELLTLEDIAQLYKVNRRQARDAIVKAPDFPAIAPGSTPRKPRWSAVAVRRYIRQGPHKSRTPA